MPGTPIQVGPFVGGLNTFSDPTAIADNELTVCNNFELDLDGSLKSRPPIQDLGIDFPLAATGDIEFLGTFQVSQTESYLLASDGDSRTYYFNGSAWVLITDTIAAAGFVQFDDKAWLTAPVGSTNPGGYWTVAGGFVADANMPEGECIVSFKGRLWIAEGRDSTNQGTRLYRSRTLADPSLWQATNDFVDIGTGDGQNIVQLIVYFNTLLIFRTNSTFGLQYTTDPAAAVVSQILPTVGLNSRYAITQFESYIYFMYDEKAYEFTNSRASQINVKTPFTSTSTLGLHNNYAVSEFNRRIEWIQLNPYSKVSPEQIRDYEEMVLNYPIPYDLTKFAKLLAFNGYEAEARHQLWRLKTLRKIELRYEDLLQPASAAQ